LLSSLDILTSGTRELHSNISYTEIFIQLI